MSKGIAALSYLPPISIVVDGSEGGSIETMKSVARLVARFQNEEIADGSYSSVRAKSITPYHSVAADVVVASAGAEISAALVAVDTQELSSLDALGRAALSTRRLITVDLPNAGGLTFTVRSLLSVLNFVEKLEDRVAQTGDPAEGDATYTDISVKGHSPYESFVWTVVKLADAYTLTPTANS